MREEILSLLTEDYYGLWELQVQLGGQRGQVARAVGELLDVGLVAWFYRAADTGPATPAGVETPQLPDLGDDLPWRVPGALDGQWLLGATAAGKDAYFGASD